MTGWVLVVAGLVILGAEIWLVTTGVILLGAALIALTSVTLAIVVSELRA